MRRRFLIIAAAILGEVYDFSPAAIIKNLHLTETNYEVITSTGQFGQAASVVKDGDADLYFYPWEDLNLVEDFKKAFTESSKKEDFTPASSKKK